MAQRSREATGVEALTVVADRGYFDGEEIRACEEDGITTFVPKPLTSGSKAKGRFGKEDFIYIAQDDEYRCPAGQRLVKHFYRASGGTTFSINPTTHAHAFLRTQIIRR